MTAKTVRALGTGLLIAAFVLPGSSVLAMSLLKPWRANLIGAFVLWGGVPTAFAGVTAWSIAGKSAARNFAAKACGIWFGAGVIVLITAYLFIAVWIPLAWQPRLTSGAEASIKLLPALEFILFGIAYLLAYLIGRAASRQKA
ncbi:MAG TPA: hypothetical protein VFR08_00710 [Candidatus Angelobacter sp.]|nr:hypothetical protein [Candidatus Angelobacter sp.]